VPHPCHPFRGEKRRKLAAFGPWGAASSAPRAEHSCIRGKCVLDLMSEVGCWTGIGGWEISSDVKKSPDGRGVEPSLLERGW